MKDFASGSPCAAVIVALLLSAGCCHQEHDLIGPTLHELAGAPVDLAPPMPPIKDIETPKAVSPRDRLRLPGQLPGADTPDIQLPPRGLDNRPEREQSIQKNFPEPPPIGSETPLAPGPEGRPLTLSDLQQMALNTNPVVRQAVARVEAARGAAIQAGLGPNPTVGYEGDTMATAGLAGYQGGYIEQTVKTGGKLQLARAAAEMDVAAAELALRSARNDVITKVRAAYFDLLWARENLRIARAVTRLTEEVYELQLDLLKAGQAAGYEVLQFRAQATQSRAALADARNRAAAAWTQLVAVVGVPDMPPTELDGRLDRPAPLFDAAKVLAHVLDKHTDVLTAHVGVQKARYLLRLAQVTPMPDVDLRVMVQKDYTSDTFLLAPSLAVGVAVPVWDRNQGNIHQAQADLARAGEEAQRVRIELRDRAATAFERYQTGRQTVELYNQQILPDLVRVYRGVYDRYQTEPDKVNFNDVAVAQQNLVNAINTYQSSLATFWKGVIEVANLLQTDDLFGLSTEHCIEPLPDLTTILQSPR